MEPERYDALVIGGGPGGSTAASYLARDGRRVLLLEKEFFPRFHIGESLLPYNRRIFDELGLTPKLEALNPTRKYGAQFHTGDGARSLFLVFRDGKFTRETEAFQVERAAFDQVLLNHARELGAEAREGWTVARYRLEGGAVTLEARGPQGQLQSFSGQFLIDASGRANLTGNQDRQRCLHPTLKKIAIFGHFAGVALDPGEKGGDTVIVRLKDKWFWLIPLAAERVSVGCVMDRSELEQGRSDPEDLFERLWRASPLLAGRMRRAKALQPIQMTGDFSYHNKWFYGPRLLRVGDAAGFMDPIFSAGVYLAMNTGKQAAQAVARTLAAGDAGHARFRRYHDRVERAMQFYWRMAEGFYTQPFLEVFFSPREKWRLASAINALLAGELEGGWAMRWRMRLFFLIVRFQSRWPLVPRILFPSSKETRQIDPKNQIDLTCSSGAP